MTMVEKVTTGTAATPEVRHDKVFPPLDPKTFAPQLIWLALTFGLLYVLLKRIALPRVGKIIKDRQDRIHHDLKQAERLTAQTDQALRRYEQLLAEARAKGNAIARAMHDEMLAEVDNARTTAEVEIAAKLKDADALIVEAKLKALGDVSEVATDIAGATVAKLIGEEVSMDELRRAVVRRAAE
jgi:F-type H+-transporting ATPase subunit b